MGNYRDELLTEEVKKFVGWAYDNGIDFSYMGKTPGNVWIQNVLDRYAKEQGLKDAIVDIEKTYGCELRVVNDNTSALDKISEILNMNREEINRAKGNDIQIFITSDGGYDSYLIDGK